MPIIHVPHAGSMILGPVGPTHVRFSDIATHERQEINSQAWVMEMSAEGDVALCSADGKADTMLLAEDLHKKVMLKSTVIGEVFLKQAIGTMVSLQMLVGRLKEAQITLKIGASLGCVVYRCSVLMVPRPGNMKVFWGVVDIYNGLGLGRTITSTCSQWLSCSRNRWSQALQEVGFVDQFDVAMPRKGDPTPQSCSGLSALGLQRSSMTTVAFVFLLTRWSFLSPRLGGLRVQAARDAAREHFDAVLAASFRDDETEWSFDWILDEPWESRWPRPEYYNPLTLGPIKLSKGGLLGIECITLCPRSRRAARFFASGTMKMLSLRPGVRVIHGGPLCQASFTKGACEELGGVSFSNSGLGGWRLV